MAMADIGDGLYEVDIGISQGTKSADRSLPDGAIVLAVGDINDSKHNDLISMSDDQMTVTVSYFNNDEYNFDKQKVLPTGDCKTSAAFIISNLNYRIALVCTEDPNHDYVKLFKNDDKFSSETLSSFKMKKGSQPLFIDINSDTFLDLVYNQDVTSNSFDIRVALYNEDNAGFETSTQGLLEEYLYENPSLGCQSLPNKEQLILESPNFSSNIDVNNDCVSDLYLNVVNTAGESKGLMLISTRIKNNAQEFRRYCLVEADNLSSSKLSSPVFADFDKDASVDKAFFNTETNSIYVYYNEMQANGPSSSSLCKSMPLIENSESETDFNSYSLFENVFDVISIGSTTGLYANSLVSNFIPGQMRVGDIDSNGFPDILITKTTPDGNPSTTILVNTECTTQDSASPTSEQDTKNEDCKKRTFDTSHDYTTLTDQIDTSLYAFFLDFDDNGREDIILVGMGTSGKTVARAFYNNYARDSYYITATSYTSSSSSFGSKVYGSTYRGIYTTLQDSNKVFVSFQNVRNSYGALEAPVATFAIGRSNNYIEDFTATYPIQKYTKAGGKDKLSVEVNTWTPIIPNSHLLVDLSAKTANKWGIKLLINPTDSFILVGIILTLILIIIGGIIIYIHRQEKKEDDKERNPGLDFF
eukprot:CAMPEP_0196995026 /NCGR_PEP_ID=MMETSP1380-20130617/1219_1 /TAXON_ID=5936 /ORGANISM="Euplotes crassus, Strain CT5" /LENGTH=642 /DNA_ID=CAMNT_0042410577 /DNA_START=126 /DNA_END=2055 /DNA_ORIENTATION=+